MKGVSQEKEWRSAEPDEADFEAGKNEDGDALKQE
jgi:hypothetical protein